MQDDDGLMFADDDSDMMFAADDGDDQPVKAKEPWVVAIVDDDEQVHEVTKLALKSFEFDNRPLEFISAYSGKEAIEMFSSRGDISVCLLDVVMESDHAGLEVARAIREDLRNTYTRVVLRTGQPGQAPEEEVIKRYDINDYKEKTELVRAKLITLMYSCLRSYRDIIALDLARRGLERVLDATAQVFSERFVDKFAQGVLHQLTSVLRSDEDAFYGIEEGFAAHEDKGTAHIVAGVGNFDNSAGANLRDALPAEMISALENCQQDQDILTLHTEDAYLCSVLGREGNRNILYLKGLSERDELQRKLMDVYSRNVLLAFENLYLRSGMEQAQREMFHMLGEAQEAREGDQELRKSRVSEMAYWLALEYGLSQDQAERLRQSAPLHGLGKTTVSVTVSGDADGRVSDGAEMLKHVRLGYEMLKNSENEIFRTGALVVLDHHEHWDGTGFPNGKAGEDISIEGRISAVAECFASYCADNPEQAGAGTEKMLAWMQEQSGACFDPALINILMAKRDAVTAIWKGGQE